MPLAVVFPDQLWRRLSLSAGSDAGVHQLSPSLMRQIVVAVLPGSVVVRGSYKGIRPGRIDERLER